MLHELKKPVGAKHLLGAFGTQIVRPNGQEKIEIGMVLDRGLCFAQSGKDLAHMQQLMSVD